MRELIKYIREYGGYSQEQFAKILCTSFSTVNRWENGHTLPNSIAQKQMYEICRDLDIDITEYLINEIEKDSRISKDEVILYHGSSEGIKGKIAPISRSVCDFGRGFYTGTNPMQPLTLISTSDNPVFYQLRFNLSGLKVKKFDITLEWALAIAYHRGYMDDYKDSKIYEKISSLYRDVDVIIGPIADDKMFTVLKDFFDLRITDKALINSLSALDYGMQYVIKTDKACKKLRIISEKEMSHLEKMAWQNKSSYNRDEALIETSRILMKYRRDGLYFDEIMEKE